MTDRPFEQGQIYLVKDTNVKIPDTTPRGYHNTRPVVILHCCSLNSNPAWPRVHAAPLSSRTDLKRECDLELRAGVDGVERDCLLRLDLAQPFLKDDLVGPVGVLSEDAIERMIALQLHLMGVIAFEEEEEAASDD